MLSIAIQELKKLRATALVTLNSLPNVYDGSNVTGRGGMHIGVTKMRPCDLPISNNESPQVPEPARV